MADHRTCWVCSVGVAATAHGGRGRPQYVVGVACGRGSHGSWWAWPTTVRSGRGLAPSHLIKGPRHVPHLLDLMLEVEGKQVSVGLG